LYCTICVNTVPLTKFKLSRLINTVVMMNFCFSRWRLPQTGILVNLIFNLIYVFPRWIRSYLQNLNTISH
jgi:hypothetical protein